MLAVLSVSVVSVTLNSKAFCFAVGLIEPSLSKGVKTGSSGLILLRYFPPTKHHLFSKPPHTMRKSWKALT